MSNVELIKDLNINLTEEEINDELIGISFKYEGDSESVIKLISGSKIKHVNRGKPQKIKRLKKQNLKDYE